MVMDLSGQLLIDFLFPAPDHVVGPHHVIVAIVRMDALERETATQNVPFDVMEPEIGDHVLARPSLARRCWSLFCQWNLSVLGSGQSCFPVSENTAPSADD